MSDKPLTNNQLAEQGYEPRVRIAVEAKVSRPAPKDKPRAEEGTE